MQISQFKKIFDGFREGNSAMFVYEELESPASEGDIKLAEERLNVVFPSEYKEFLLNFWGGYFVFVNVFSVSPESEWNIVELQRKYDLPSNLVAISDDQAGGVYCFLIAQDGSCLSQVFYVYLSGDLIVPEKKFESFFEYLIVVGLHCRFE